MLRKSCLATIPLVLAACTSGGGPGSFVGDGTTTGWKEDSAFVSNVSYELGTTLTSQVSREASGEWANLAEDRALQESLVDEQVKFAKLALLAEGYLVNQNADEVRSIEVEVSQDETPIVTLRYVAVVDIVKNDGRTLPVPRLEDIATRDYTVSLPLDPTNMLSRVGDRCAGDLDGGTLHDYNYYYFFSPTKQGCDVPIHRAAMHIDAVYPRTQSYPEYDRLLQDFDETDDLGFTAALMPTEGDSDPLSTHDNIKRMLEGRLNLTGERSTDDTYTRYRYARDGAVIRIDLFDPTKIAFDSTFKANLATYDFLHFAGHSEYGSRTLLSDRDAFRSSYQIYMMWSCHSYEYYSRQVVRAKRTEADPTGFDGIDMVATAPTPYFGDEDDGIEQLLRKLLDGIAAVNRGEPSAAPSWLDIVTALNGTSTDLPYGAVGVRTNTWRP